MQARPELSLRFPFQYPILASLGSYLLVLDLVRRYGAVGYLSVGLRWWLDTPRFVVSEADNGHRVKRTRAGAFFLSILESTIYGVHEPPAG